ncbi:unnamed protein product [Blepharisma stoltei]|uniref:Uncharacterized protein n=1 Tax=Blepharisma stoltei TaxID=1481888 RepID=A0AAU9IUK3_9CILI|nr:unnamed protein product [Blepharisma stoltei]
MGSCTSISYSRNLKRKLPRSTESDIDIDQNGSSDQNGSPDNHSKENVVAIEQFIQILMKEQLIRRKINEAPPLLISKSDLYSRRLNQMQHA